MTNLQTKSALITKNLKTTSLTVAEKFGKDHFHVLRDIRNLGIPDDYRTDNFGYIDVFRPSQLNGAKIKSPVCEMTRDGFSLLIMGYTGRKAMEWKIKFLEAFNAMERRLQGPAPQPALESQSLHQTFLDALKGHGPNGVSGLEIGLTAPFCWTNKRTRLAVLADMVKSGSAELVTIHRTTPGRPRIAYVAVDRPTRNERPQQRFPLKLACKVRNAHLDGWSIDAISERYGLRKSDVLFLARIECAPAEITAALMSVKLYEENSSVDADFHEEIIGKVLLH